MLISVMYTTNRYSLITISLSVFSCFLLSTTLSLSTCQSCYYGCPDMNSCECKNSNETCQGEYCFAKIQAIAYDSAVSTIFKGCTNAATPSELIGGCRYGGDQWSVECYCRGDMCNEAKLFNRYQPRVQPTVTCCACDPYNEEEDVGCMPTECYRFCKGHYCYVDLGRKSQGCGYGIPHEFQDSRTTSILQHYGDKNASQPFSCLISVAGSPNFESWFHRCTCNRDNCNMYQDAYEYDLNVTQRSNVGQIYCHSLYSADKEPATIDTYQESSYCEGHSCYVETRTSVIVNGNGGLETRYELFAGCLLSDNSSTIENGCTTEWSADRKIPYKKRCICSKDYCNLLNVITGEPREKYLIMSLPSANGATNLFKKTTIYCYLQIVFLNFLFFNFTLRKL